MKIGQMMAGKYLKKEDCDPPMLVTIDRFEEENVAREDQPTDMKWVMYFKDNEKGLVMNSTNLQLAAIAFGTQETDEWVGRSLVLAWVAALLASLLAAIVLWQTMSLSERRGAFVSAVTHELRTPLNAILGFGLLWIACKVYNWVAGKFGGIELALRELPEEIEAE